MKATKKVVSGIKVPTQIVCDLVSKIIKEYTFHHENLRVVTEEVAGRCLVVIHSHAGDTPRLIGGQGMMFKGLQVLVAAVGNKHKQKFMLKVEDPAVGERDRYDRFQAAQNWDKDKIIGLLQETCDEMFTRPVTIKVGDLNRESSLITVSVSKAEDERIIQPIGKALGIIWNAIGKANGRDLKLDLEVEGTDSGIDLGQIFG